MNTIKAEDWVGKIIAEYKIILEVGRGETGVVFLAEHTTQNYYAALKIFPAGDVAERALKSAEIVKRMSHPGVATVYDCGREGEFVFVVSEYVSYKRELNDNSFSSGKLFSKNLTEYVEAQSGLVPEKTVIYIMSQIIDALEFLHGIAEAPERTLPYGGLHPNRILVTESHNGRIKIKLTDVGVPVVRGKSSEVDAFLSPEELQGLPADERSHVYSLGAMAYALLTGAAPPSPVVPPANIRGDISAGWNEIVKKALAFEAAERYADCQALRRALLHVKSLIPKKVTFNALKAALVSFAVVIALVLVYALIYENTDVSKKVEKFTEQFYEPSLKGVVRHDEKNISKKEPVIKPEKHPIKKKIEKKIAAKTNANSEEAILDMEKSVAVDDAVEKTLPGSVIDKAVEKTSVEKAPAKKTQPQKKKIEYKIYTVKKNDSLWGIAFQHYMNVKDLLFINDLSPNVIIKAGQKLKVKKGKTRALPKPKPKPKKKKSTNTVVKTNQTDKTDKTELIEYTVKKGDTYYSLSKKFGVPVKELERINDNKKLIIGMKIKIKNE